MRRRLHLITSFVVLTLVVGLGAAYGWWRPIEVWVARPQSDVSVQVFGLGTVEARVASKVGFKVAGILTELRADHGDRVASGAVLARLDTREQATRVGRATASVDQAEANLNRAIASVPKAEATYANAKSINDRRQDLVQKNAVSVEEAATREGDARYCTG